jgi:hypothetical protein
LFNNYTSNTTSLVIDTSLDSEVENRLNPNLNQIERLIGSISNLVDFNSLELIKHFYFALWQRELLLIYIHRDEFSIPWNYAKYRPKP